MSFLILILYFFSSLLLFFLGFFCFKQNSKNVVNKAFFAFTLSSIGWMISLYSGFQFGKFDTVFLSTVFFRFAFGFGVLMAFCLPIFFHHFPRKTFKINKFFSYLFILLSVFMFLLSVGTPYIYESAIIVTEKIYIEDVLGKHYMLFLYYYFFSILLALMIGISKIITLKNKVLNQKVRFSIFGMGVFTLLVLLTNGILPMFGILIFQLESGAFSLFFSLPAFYAIIRYRFLDINLTFQHILTEVSNGLVYLLPIIIFQDFFRQFPFLLLCIPVLLFIFKKYTHGVFNYFWNYFFFGKRTNYSEDIKKSLDLFKNSIKSGVNHIANRLSVKGADLIFPEDENWKNTSKYFQNHSSSDLVLEEIEYRNKQSKSLSRAKKELGKAMIAAAIPVWGENKKLIGIFLLEKRIDGKLFSVQQIETVKKVLKDVSFYISHEKNYKNKLEKDVKTNSVFSSVETFNGLMHELRHPLMMVQNIKDLVDWKKMLPKDRKFIQEGENVLSDITHKLDAISEAFQWEHGLIELQKSHLDLRGLLDFIKKDFEDIPISIHLNETLAKKMIFIDVYRIKEAFYEVIKNSCFFAQKNPRISVTVYEKKSIIYFDVQDNGNGILKQNWNNIFELLFVESFSRNRKECGLGVGLTKANGILKKHKGSMKIIKSSPKNGTLIQIQIPKLKN